MTRLEVRGVTKRWSNGKLALDEVTFNANPGTLTALIGPSGAGKSTALRVIAGLDATDTGDVHNPFGHVGMVFQEPSLWPHLTLLENTSLPLAALRGLPAGRAAARAGEILHSWGLGDRLNAYPAELSGGEQQRGALARAWVLEPKVLCLDEVTNALDPETAAAIFSSIVSWKSQDTVLLMATHQLGFVERNADQVVFIDQGKVLEIGAPETVLHSPRHLRTQEFVTAARLR